VVSKNLPRRHLDESQRAVIAWKIANMAHGGDRRSDQTANLHSDNVSVSEAAAMMNVSRQNVFHARTVLRHGTPAEIAAVEAGEAKVSTTANQIRQRQIEPAEEAVVELRPSSHRQVGPKLPGGTTPEFIARRAVALRERGRSVNAVATELGIARQACGQMIDIVLIADKAGLPPRDRALAADLDRRLRPPQCSCRLDAVVAERQLVAFAGRLGAAPPRGSFLGGNRTREQFEPRCDGPFE
jgi:hypothetical protein